MLKSAILLFNTIALLMYQFFFADVITVTQKVPSSAKPDSEFTVELTIKKGSTTGFAKLQQELPEGFTAVEDKSTGASFTFNNQSVKFIWMSLPNDAEFKVSYKVKVAEGISGDQTIAGKFSYVTDNEKKVAEIDAATISVTGDGSTTASTKSTTTTDNTSTGNNTTTGNTTTDNTSTAGNTTTGGNTTGSTAGSGSEDGSLTCTRNMPSSASGEFVVEINVNKGNLSGFAKLLETLPSGFTASSMESSGGSFSFADQKVRFIWVSLPAQTEFKISYKVKVAKNVTGAQSIDGTFSYIEEDNTKKYTMPTGTVTIGSGGTIASTNNNNNNNSNSNNNNNNNNNNSSNSNSNNSNNNNSLSANNITAPQAGVIFRVQIMALQNNRTASFVANYYNMSPSDVQKMPDQGLNKYLLKNTHTEYQRARDAREAIKGGVVRVNTQARQPEAPPFVVAFNSGRRITVQDALMITSQKWYR
jgi:hypothetical protein